MYVSVCLLLTEQSGDLAHRDFMLIVFCKFVPYVFATQGHVDLLNCSKNSGLYDLFLHFRHPFLHCFQICLKFCEHRVSGHAV